MLVCGSGAGAAMAACKMTGIRAAICHDLYSAHQAVEHDDMNVLCLGSEIVGPSVARELVGVFLGAEFDGGERYVARLEKVELRWKGGCEMASRRLQQLAARGQSIWIDLLSRELVHSGELRRMVDETFGHGPDVEPVDLPEGDRRRRRLRRPDRASSSNETDDPRELFFAARDRRRPRRLRRAAPGLGARPSGPDGFVSLEVDPGLAFDTRGDVRAGGRAPRRASTGRTSTSRSRRPRRACRRSRTASPAASRSTSP